MAQLPKYDELPVAPHGGRSAWHVFGDDDEIGTINLVTPERIVRSARLVRRGAIFPLDAPLNGFMPSPVMSRSAPRHTLIHAEGSIGFDDVLDNFYLQGSSQWDSLAHYGYFTDQFYNGASEAEIAAGGRNTIDQWAKHGIAGRGVLLDMVRTLAEDGRPYDPGQHCAITVEDLELARKRAGVEFESGDFVLLYTGFAEWYRDQSLAKKEENIKNKTCVGLDQGEEMCRYLWNSHIAGIAADNIAVEARPHAHGTAVPAVDVLHRMLIGQFGMALGELWWLKDLADDCAKDGVYEIFLVSCPLNVAGGIGSPPNAVAIK